MAICFRPGFEHCQTHMTDVKLKVKPPLLPLKFSCQMFHKRISVVCPANNEELVHCNCNHCIWPMYCSIFCSVSFNLSVSPQPPDRSNSSEF